MPDSKYLEPTFFIDSDNKDVIAFAEKIVRDKKDENEKAIALYYAVRDQILYDPYAVSTNKQQMRASSTLQNQKGFCVTKAILLAALLRYVKIPSRLGFADVTNHLNTENLKKQMGTDIFYYHGYTDIYLNGKWVKATPAFNISLCDKFGTKPLEFDGINDSIFHPFDKKGQKHMEYINDHGHFADLPFETIYNSYKKHYPALFELNKFSGDFHKEAGE